MPSPSTKEKSGGTKSGKKGDSYVALWDMNTSQLDAWAKTHHTIFPKREFVSFDVPCRVCDTFFFL